jgi:hypothetical protein
MRIGSSSSGRSQTRSMTLIPQATSPLVSNYLNFPSPTASPTRLEMQATLEKMLEANKQRAPSNSVHFKSKSQPTNSPDEGSLKRIYSFSLVKDMKIQSKDPREYYLNYDQLNFDSAMNDDNNQIEFIEFDECKQIKYATLPKLIEQVSVLIIEG